MLSDKSVPSNSHLSDLSRLIHQSVKERRTTEKCFLCVSMLIQVTRTIQDLAQFLSAAVTIVLHVNVNSCLLLATEISNVQGLYDVHTEYYVTALVNLSLSNKLEMAFHVNF